MAFANNVNQDVGSFDDNSDLLTTIFATSSHFESMTDNSFNGMECLRTDMSVFGTAPEPPFSIDPAALDLSSGASNSAVFTNGFPDEAPQWDLNTAFEHLEPMDGISSQVFADPFGMEDISTAQPITNSQPSLPSYPENNNQITIISGGKTIHLDSAEAINMFTASGLSMLMESREINDNLSPALEHEPIDLTAEAYQSTVIPTSWPENPFMDSICQTPRPNDVMTLFGAESYQPAIITNSEFRLTPGNECDMENYITSLDDTQIELLPASFPSQAQLDNTRNETEFYELSNIANANQSHTYPPSTVADKYPSIRPKQSASDSHRNVEFIVKVKR
jgi:hypothetical protein